MTQDKKTATVAAWLVVAPLLSSSLAAQVQIEKRRPAPVDVPVRIENSFGSVTVRTWDRHEVLVQGELAPGARGLDLDGDQEGIHIEVEEPDHWFYAPSEDGEFRSRLEIMVPVGASLQVETVNASIDVAGTWGELDLQSVNGSVTAVAQNGWIEVETMTGTVDVTADAASMAVESITGDVTLRGVAGEVEVDSLEGAVTIVGRDLASVQVETVTGSVSVTGTLAKRGELEIDTFSGAVALALPRDVRADFEIETFSGEIRSAFGPSRPVSERFEPYRILEFSTGYDEYEIEITTHEGDIDIQVAGGSG